MLYDTKRPFEPFKQDVSGKYRFYLSLEQYTVNFTYGSPTFPSSALIYPCLLVFQTQSAKKRPWSWAVLAAAVKAWLPNCAKSHRVHGEMYFKKCIKTLFCMRCSAFESWDKVKGNILKSRGALCNKKNDYLRIIIVRAAKNAWQNQTFH